jgi:hypothetical protein
MSNIRGIGSGKKPEAGCQWCGKVPACPGYTCGRLATVLIYVDGSVEVTFVETVEFTFTPEPPPE